MRRMSGPLVYAIFGTVFVMAGAGAPFTSALSAVLRVLGIAAFFGVIVLGRRKAALQPADRAAPAPLGRAYWLNVIGEAVLIFAGIAVLVSSGQPAQAIVPWIAIPVGLHFLVLIPILKLPSYAIPGSILTLLGIAGLVVAQTSAVAWAPVVGGLLSGVTLLAFAVVNSWPRVPRAAVSA